MTTFIFYLFLMKKYIGYVIITALLLGWCTKNTPQENTIEKQQITEATEQTFKENEATFEWTLKNLLELWKNIECSFNFEDETTKEEWKILVAKKEMKSTAKVFLKKENIGFEAYTLIKDDYTYSRSNAEKSQWVKFKVSENNNESSNKKDPLDEKRLQFICEEKEIDKNEFTIPSEIEFTDITNNL